MSSTNPTDAVKGGRGGSDEPKSKPGPKSSKAILRDIKPVTVVLRREKIPLAKVSEQEKEKEKMREWEECPDTDVEEENTPSLPPAANNVGNNREENLLDEEIGPLPKRRKRGRPATTGAYYALQERRAAQQEEDERREEREMLSALAPSGHSQAWDRLEESAADYAEEIRQAPTVDIAARGLEKTTVLKKWVIKCKNIKGTVRKEVGQAACYLQAAISALAASSLEAATPSTRNEGETEVEGLQRHNRLLRSQILVLEAETERLKEEARAKRRNKRTPPTPPTPVATTVMEGEPRVNLEAACIPLPEDAMEATSYEGVELCPIQRPPVKGVSKQLEKEYPPEIKKGEDRAVYDSLSDEIQRLLNIREGLKKGAKPPLANPPSSVAKTIATINPPTPNTSRRYAEALKRTPVPGKTGGKKEDKGQPPKKGKGPNAGTRSAVGASRDSVGARRSTRDIEGPTRDAEGARPRGKAATQPRGKGEPKKARAQAPPANNPPPLPRLSDAQDTWAKVVGRKERRRQQATTSGPAAPSQQGQRTNKASPPLKSGRDEGKAQPAVRRRASRVPRTAAVVITCPPGQYAAAISTARSRVDLEALNITGIKARRALTGAIVYEIPGEGKAAKADQFASKLQEAMQGMEGVRVSRPSKKAEIRVLGLDDSATVEEVTAEIAKLGGCSAAEIKAGEIRFSRGAMGTLWVQCPAVAANKVTAAGKIRVGWVTARVEPLAARPLQCFKCLEKGHVREQCSSAVDRSDCCYNCGSPGHRANGCTQKTRCPACAERGVAANHRIGSQGCTSKKRRKPTRNNKEEGARRAEGATTHPPSSSQATKGETPKPQRAKRVPPPKGKKVEPTSNPPAEAGVLREVVMEEA